MADIVAGVGGSGRAVSGPWALRGGTWRAVLWRTVSAVWNEDLTDRAASLTYYSVISLLPGAVVVSSLLGLAGPSATRSLIDTITELGYGGDNSVSIQLLEQLQSARSLAGPAALVGLVTALWTASGYIGAFVRAINAIYDTEEGRPLWKTVPLRIGLTAALVVLVVVCAGGVLLSGRFAEVTGRWLGFGPAAVSVWGVPKWPVLALLVSVVIALLYWAAPNARQLGLRWLTPGSVFAVALWVAVSVGFAFYVAHFGSYNKVYGSLAGAVVFLVWMWLSNVAILLGAKLDAELARGRHIEQGGDADATPILPHRDAPDPN
ncbi:YihY/virulence factor BrkB family protein [Nocardia takedensis]